jgi:hypothetical protein
MARQWWEQHLPELTGPLTINATVPLASETPTLIGGSDGMLTGLGKKLARPLAQMIRRRLILLALLVASAAPAFAQDQPSEPASRAEELRREREKKNGTLAPYEQGGTEKAAVELEQRRILERFLVPAQGFYPAIGAITGGGFSGGVGFRKASFFNRHLDFNASASGTLQHYWLLDAKVSTPSLLNPDKPFFGDFHLRRFSYPDEDFFGIGPSSARDDKSSYDMDDFAIGATSACACGRGCRSAAAWITSHPAPFPAPASRRLTRSSIRPTCPDSTNTRTSSATRSSSTSTTRSRPATRAGADATGRIFASTTTPFWSSTPSAKRSSTSSSTSRSSTSAASSRCTPTPCSRTATRTSRCRSITCRRSAAPVACAASGSSASAIATRS